MEAHSADVIWPSETVKRYVELEDEARLTTLHPALERMCGPLLGVRVLDFGCGDGIFVRRHVLPHNPEAVLAVDHNRDIILHAELALEAGPPTAPARWLHGDETDVASHGPFDVIVCSLVLMMTGDRERMQVVVRELVGALASPGRLLIAVTHPCYRKSSYPSISYRLPERFSYWESGKPYEVVLRSPRTGEEVSFHDFHWTVEDYVEAIDLAKGHIARVVAVPGEAAANGKPLGDPAYLVFEVTPAVAGHPPVMR